MVPIMQNQSANSVYSKFGEDKFTFELTKEEEDM